MASDWCIDEEWLHYELKNMDPSCCYHLFICWYFFFMLKLILCLSRRRFQFRRRFGRGSDYDVFLQFAQRCNNGRFAIFPVRIISVRTAIIKKKKKKKWNKTYISSPKSCWSLRLLTTRLRAKYKQQLTGMAMAIKMPVIKPAFEA